MPDSERSTIDAWDAARDQVNRYDESVGAVITWIDDSRNDAVACDEDSRNGKSRGPLHGMLVGLKDNIDTAGVPTTAGASFLRDRIPGRDATVVRRLRRAGAVVVGKLNLAELAWGGTTQNRTFGSCRNPWDLNRIPGGSSGGSGAAVAARFCDAALGTDTGASVRSPAAMNGVVGLRPTIGSVPNSGTFPVAPTQDTVGPMARNARELAILVDVLRGIDPDDPYSRRTLGAGSVSQLEEPIEGLRVGVPPDFFFDDLDEGVSCRIEEFLSWLASSGVHLVKVPSFRQDEAYVHWATIVQSEGAAVHADRLATSPSDFSPDVFARLEAGLETTGVALARSLHWRVTYRQRIATRFDRVDAIVTPVIPCDVPAIPGFDSRELQTTELGTLRYAWALHAGPTMSLPIGFHPQSGMPVAAAIAAAEWRESRLFQLAAAYQRDSEWHLQRPPMRGQPNPNGPV